MRKAALLFFVLVLFGGGLFAEGAWLGVNIQAVSKPAGILVTNVVSGSPAARGGLRPGDVIVEVDGETLENDEEGVLATFRKKLAERNPGDETVFTVLRKVRKLALFVNGREVPAEDPEAAWRRELDEAGDGDTVELRAVVKAERVKVTVVLGERPKGKGISPNWQGEVPFTGLAEGDDSYRKLAEALIAEAGIGAQFRDQMARLARCHKSPDAFRKRLMMGVHTNPFSLEDTARAVRDMLSEAAAGDRPLSGVLGVLAGMNWYGVPPASAPLKTGLDPKAHVERITSLLKEAARHLDRAFAALSDEEMAFVRKNRAALGEALVNHIYLHIDPDKKRFENNMKIIETAAKVNFAELLAAERALAPLADRAYLEGLKKDLLAAYGDDASKAVVAQFDSPFGPIVIGGTGHTWYRDTAGAVIIDLGGPDFYTCNAGSGAAFRPVYKRSKDGREQKDRPLRLPIGVVLELGGDDAYESTRGWEQGSGSLGCGLLVDLEGNDEYVSIRWGQAASFLGSAALVDFGGDDAYRGREFCQAAAVFGLSALLDMGGNDRYEGDEFCQSLAGAGGTSLLYDAAGDDSYYCKGSYPTNYGDPGIFDAWAQGAALGFRGIASGGIAVLLDGAGKDRYEAGNFSQGGGYYFGFGMMFDRGRKGDYYMGSRYAQGFSAHTAVGAFIDEGGDDHYGTRQGVAQGLAWDESVSLFADDAGNDVYEGGSGFSQGASAHNGFCIFADRGGGDDVYLYKAGQGRAGGNDYHGGTSFSLFIEEGGNDRYTAPKSADNLIRIFPEYGVFADLPAPVSRMLAEGLWKDLVKVEKRK